MTKKCSVAWHESLKADKTALERETTHQGYWLGMELRQCSRCGSTLAIVIDPLADTAEAPSVGAAVVPG